MLAEEWKEIKDFNSYYVSNFGRIKHKNKILKPIKSRNGYLHIFLYKNKIKKQFLIHRLVAIEFIDNTSEYNEVNHIDSDKENNRIDNLEWCTRKQNVHHFLSTNNRNDTNAKEVIQYDLYGNLIKKYKSIRSASTETGISPHNIIFCCRGQKTTASNFIWKYAIV